MLSNETNFCVYLILCDKNRLYTGISNRPKERFLAHVDGKGARFTKMYPPIEMRILISGLTKSEALRSEHATKKLNAQTKRQLWSQLPTFIQVPVFSQISAEDCQPV
ncbi:GIY-YIG nuclease family protein [Neisseria sp. Ec49-e6-T10]|uniref:GIY-YIG nuclease family protein n=1 Tax=Neisseria sp. Ec49-e6-T10 TaxID=3140744 RepID=UPI003EBD173C